jgi:hypothetical protein
MQTLRVNFVDFWANHFKDDNYFYNLLSTKYKVIIDETDPDIVFYSVDYDRKNEKQRYLGTRAKMIYYTGENSLPNWDECDLAFTFSYVENGKNYRLPLWAMYFNWFNRPYNSNRDHAFHYSLDAFLEKKIDMTSHLKTKTKFCNFVSSNPTGRRVSFVPKLMNVFPNSIVSAGSMYNNTGSRLPGRSDTIEKFQFLKQFKFTVAFEHTQSEGYTTEKLIHPMFANSIPIYWGSPRVSEEFNVKSFINANDLSDEHVFEKITNVYTDFDLYVSMLKEPWFVNNRVPESILPSNVLGAIEKCLT